MSQQVVYELSIKDLFTGKLNNANAAVNKFESNIGNAQIKLMDLGRAAGIAFGISEVVNFGREVFNVTRQIDSLKIGLNQISGGQGEETFKYLQGFSDKLGLDFESAANGFRTIGAAARETSLEGQGVKEIFESVGQASAVLGLSGEQTTGSLLAIGQMISKGTVAAEELRGQLGERLPGAFQIAARSMGVTTAKLGDMMQKGNVIAEDFLPKFAAQLKQEMSGGLPAAMISLNAELNRAKNEVTFLQLAIGDNLKPVFISVLKSVKSFTEILKESWGWISANAEALKALAIGAAVSFGLYKGYLITTMAIQATQTVITYGQIAAMYVLGAAYDTASIATKLLAAAQYALNAVMMANPIGLIVVGIGALVAGIVYAYNHFEKFRGIVWATWEVLKEFGRTVANIFVGVGKAIVGAITFNPSMVAEGAAQTIEAVRGAGERIGRAAQEGYEAGIADFQKGKATIKAPANVSPKGGKGAGKNAPTLPSETKGAKGQKAVTINIKIQDLVKELSINTVNMKEGAGKLREIIAETLMAATNDAQLISGQ